MFTHVATTGKNSKPSLPCAIIWHKYAFDARRNPGEELVERSLPVRQTHLPRGIQKYFYLLLEAFENDLSESTPAPLFSDARVLCRSINSARSLLALNSTYTVAKAALAVLAKAAFCFFQLWEPVPISCCKEPGVLQHLHEIQ